LLADSILANGIIQPIAVRKKDGKFLIIAGERRFRAAKMAGLRRIPCVIHSADEQTAAILALTENLQRRNLNVFEEAAALDRLINYYGITQSEAAIKLGLAQSTLSNKLRLLNLSDDLQQKIVSARLTERHARALLRLPQEKRASALDHVIDNGMNLSKSEKYIEELLNKKENSAEDTQTRKPTRKYAIGDIRIFYNSLSKLVTTLQSAGINAQTKRYETPQYVEIKVLINKSEQPNDDKQIVNSI
jgi:ParB family chromosome partitioning protein